MMEKTYSSVSVTKCNSERQRNLKVGETSYSKSIAQKQKSSHHAETDVMVERVSSTTEQSLFTAHRKPPSPQSRLASRDKIPMSQEQRNREKHIHTKTHDNRDASKFKPVKAGRSSPLRERDRDKGRDGQHQGTLSASKRDEMSHTHSSVKKRIPRRDSSVDANISSSSLVLKSRGSSLSSTSSYARKSSNSYSERDPKSYSKCGKGFQSSGDSSAFRSHAFRENSSQDASRQKHYWEDGEGNCKESSSLSESSMNRKPNPYKKMVENRIREIRNNIEKMSSKEMVEKKVKEIRSNLEKMSADLPQSLVESLEAVTESASEEKDRRYEEYRENSPLIPFLPSSRCCSPPPRTAIVEKYWSDADETEDESDSEKHLMHVNSVNIVLNYLKNNSGKYYVDGKEITKQMNAKLKKKGSIKSRLSYQSDSKSHNNWSKSGHSKGRSGGFTVSENESELDPYGLGLFIKMQKARKRDSTSRDPSGNIDLFDRKSIRSPSRDSHCYRSEHSPSSLQESFSTSRRSCSPSCCEDYKYMHSPSYKNRRGSRSPSRHRRDRASCSPHRYRGSCSPSRHTRHRGSRSPPRLRGSRSPSRHRRLMRSRSPSRKRIDRASRSPPRHRGSRSPSRQIRHRGSHSPPRHRSSSYRESCSPSRYRGGSHRNRESPSYTQYSRSSSPHYSEDNLSNRGSPTWTWDAEDSLTNRNRISVLHEQYSIQKQKLSPKSLHRYGIKRSRYSEDLCIEFMNPQKKSKTGSENYGANSREQHYRPEMNWDKILPKDRGTQLEEGSSNTNRTGHGSRALSPSHSDRQISIRDRITHSFESSGSVSHEGSVETIITRMIRQESGFERPTSNSKKKNISKRWQQVKRENEVKLPLAFGRGAKKTLKSDEAFNWNKDFLSVDTRNNQRREDRTTSEVDAFQNNNNNDDDDDDDDDDEPIIDRPEDYLSASSTMTMYRPSFVPDTHDREKLADLPKTNRLSQPHEGLSMAGPSGFTSLPTSCGKEQDDSPHRLSGSECDGVIENVDCAVPQVSSSGVSLEPVLSGATTSEKSTVFDLSTALKGVTTEAVKSEKDEPALTLSSAEMSTLLTLIKLAKDHVATGKDLPSNFSQVLETGGGAMNSKTAEPQGKHSGKNQEQPSISQVSTDMQDKVTNENAKATAFESVAMDDIAESEKNAKATAESASIDDIAESETNARATASTDEGMNDKTKIVNSTKAVISKSDGKQDKAGEKIPNPTSLKSNTMNNKDIIDGQNVGHIASIINKKIDINPEDETGEIVPKKKKSDDHFSQWKGDSKPPQSVNKVQESKTDGRLLKVGKNPQQSSKGNIDKTTQEKTKGKGQSPKKLENKHVSSSKKKTFQQDEKREFSKSDSKSSVIERTFRLMQSVRVDLSASQETIASRKRAKHHRRIADLENAKKQLKQVGKRIFMDCSSDSEDDIPKKEESPGAGKGPQETSFIPDLPVSLCLACKCNLKLDEFTTVSLNTGIVTLTCRNCHTCRKMEKVLSLQCYPSTPKSKNVTSKESEDNSNSKDNKTANETSSKQRKNENTSQKDGSSQRTNSSKQTSKKKEDIQQEGNVIKEKKGKTPAFQKIIEEKPKVVDAKNTSKTVSVFKKDKCQGGRKEAERNSVPKKDTNSKMNEEKEIAKSTSNDPHINAPRWLSNTKMMGLFDNLELRETSGVEDRCNTKQQNEKSCDKRKPDALSSKKKHDKTTASSSKSTEVVKPTTTTKVDNAPKSSDADRISISAKSALNTDPKVKSRMSTTPKSRTTTKSITTTASTQPLPSNATIKRTMHSGPNATSKLITTCKPCHIVISTSETKAKHITEIKAATQTECDSPARSTSTISTSNIEEFCGFGK